MLTRVVIGAALLMLFVACSQPATPPGTPLSSLNQTNETIVDAPNVTQNATPNVTQNQSGLAGVGEFCGGLSNIQCVQGYYCVVDAVNPRVGGKCVSEGAGAGQPCGGTQGIKCTPTLVCKKPNYAEAIGTCVASPDYPNDPSYCDTNDDCVRQASCCDCAFGTWVNKEHYNESLCPAGTPRCMCATRERLPLCQNHQCTSRPIPYG